MFDRNTNKYITDADVKVTCDFGKWIPTGSSFVCVPGNIILNWFCLFSLINTNIIPKTKTSQIHEKDLFVWFKLSKVFALSRCYWPLK